MQQDDETVPAAYPLKLLSPKVVVPGVIVGSLYQPVRGEARELPELAWSRLPGTLPHSLESRNVIQFPQ
nr:hypothetical protein [Caulifigura coniformis]